MEKYERKSFNNLRSECKSRGLAPCFGKGVNKSFLLDMLVRDDSKQTSVKAGPTSTNEGVEEREEEGVEEEENQVTHEEARGKGRRASVSLEDRLLTVDGPAKLDKICFAHDCTRVDWRTLLEKRDASVAAAVQKVGFNGDWHAIYRQTVAFKERFRTSNDFGDVTADQMDAFPVIWPAMVASYRKMRHMAARIGDKNALRTASLTEEQKRDAYSFSGTRDVAHWLLEGLTPSMMGSEFIMSVGLCNELPAEVLLSSGVVYDVRQALEASLYCPEILSRLLVDNSGLLSDKTASLLAKAYADGLTDVLALIVLNIPEIELHNVLVPHLVLLARRNEVGAIERALGSVRVLHADMQKIFEEAVLHNSVDVVAFVRLFEGLNMGGLLRKASLMNRAEIMRLVYEMIPDKELCDELDKALLASEAANITDSVLLLSEWRESCDLGED